MNRHAGVKHLRLDPATNPYGATRMIVFDLEAMMQEAAKASLQLAALATTRRHQARNKRRRHR